MKVPLKWIRELTGVETDTDTLISKIRSQLGEVESVEELDEKYRKILLAKIDKAEAHPNADTLGVFQVDIGSGSSIQVVAGDKSLKEGDKVAYIPPGTKVPYNPRPEQHDGVVQAITLRGVESNGMLASERELDLGPDHTKVLVIQTDRSAGTPISEVLELDDTVIDIENKALTNRQDCFGIIGIAREVSGIVGKPFTSPQWFTEPQTTLDKVLTDSTNDLSLHVSNEAEALCQRYTAIVLKDIKVAPSPIWLKAKLIKSGLRPINNVVDITNYIMILLGQPLHAFDYDKLRSKDPNAKDGAYITVRTARSGEKITTLDGQTHDLYEDNLLICDSTNPIAVAGIMGGSETEIDENTKNIVIESANFDMYNNRKSSMQLGISTDAVTRFSKGLDPEAALAGLAMAIEMVIDLTGGTPASEVIDVYPGRTSKKQDQIQIDLSYLNSRLGTSLSRQEVIDTLSNVELTSTKTDPGLLVQIPSFRRDLNIEEDIQEEVARLRGYDQIPITLPKRSLLPVDQNPLVRLKTKVRDSLIDLGLNEVLTYNFISLKDLERLDLRPEKSYRLTNPLSPELEFMRPSLAPSLLDKVKKNLLGTNSRVGLFEINKAHHKDNVAEDGLPIELELMGIVIADEQYDPKISGAGYYHLKAYWTELLANLSISNTDLISLSKVDMKLIPEWYKDNLGLFDQNASAVIILRTDVGDRFVGFLGELNPTLVKKLKLPRTTLYLEVDLLQLVEWYSSVSKYNEPSRFPFISYDLCFILDADVPYTAVEVPMKKVLHEENLNSKIEAVDIYRSEDQKKEGMKQITLRVNLNHSQRTLTNDDAKEIIKRIVRAVRRETNATVKE
ncbi:phenylalanine--tRNA ligase subunit beta [Candidatus Nomurabacteria bacterium]|uniref:Phenylalanine--tRNA ligase beta subunit n=1 Tax=Candidatus Dojkabacteria bacterium TaxID=2099670 RepID=A0A955I1E0_9BACT|nr:phenylalanine--tRNA ligase subunit beta [Candidatus Dojkabacteria bacterium]MCB9789899.1 phenylalanine--tRNA ligase subunit beta [Candidatus Nomurabacteria bacterium]MCB9803478.1 phenylalanine--tRNA ligase subunit beta [Candidatus Nomurabacteria bacterium]